MPGNYVSPLALGFAGLRLGCVLVALVAIAVMWRRPRPAAALGLVLAMHVGFWIGYRAPLQRPYALDVGTDRSFNIGMAAATALGRSPFEHTQVAFGSPEPFWNLLVAALSGFSPHRAPVAWDLLTPIALLTVGAGAYFGLRGGDGPDQWERVLVVFSILGLVSLHMSARPPVPAFWVGNFMLKPHHAISYGVVAWVLGAWARPRPPWWTALALGALAWVFLVNWAYLLVALALGVALLGADHRAPGRRAAVVLASVLVAAPYVLHLARDYAPYQLHRAARHMWDDELGMLLAVPTWSTLDLGPLLTGAVAGVIVLRRRGSPLDRVLVALVLASMVLWLGSVPATLLGVAPEPDELHYFLRFSLALAAGAALAAAARLLDRVSGLGHGRAHLAVLAACLPMSFPAYWDPPTMDRYYPASLKPVPGGVLEYCRWISSYTPPEAVFVAGPTAASYVPAFTGRRVLLNEAGKLKPRDYEQRRRAQDDMLFQAEPHVVRAAARDWGVTHVVVDDSLTALYNDPRRRDMGPSAAWTPVFSNRLVRILSVTPSPARVP